MAVSHIILLGVVAGSIALLALVVPRSFQTKDPLDAAIQDVLETGPDGAVVAWARSDGKGEARSYGTLENVDGPEQLRLRLASLTKPVTSAAVMELVQRGSLSLSDRIGTLLPELRFSDASADQITLRDLLQHSAGFDETKIAPLFLPPEDLARDLDLDLSGETDCDALAHAMARQPLGFLPGETYLYSNTGYCLLDMILRSRVDIAFEASIHNLLPEARGFTLDATLIDVEGTVSPGQQAFLVRRPDIVGGAGGLIGSAAAYLRFLERPVAVHVVSPPAYVGDDPHFYGLGWRVWRDLPCPARTHFGSMPGAFSVALVDRDGARFVALFVGRPPEDWPAFTAIVQGACALFESGG